MNVEQKTLYHQRRVVLNDFIYLDELMSMCPSSQCLNHRLLCLYLQNVLVVVDESFVAFGTVYCRPFKYDKRWVVDLLDGRDALGGEAHSITATDCKVAEQK